MYNTYLKLVYYSCYSQFSRTVLGDYAELYRKQKVASSLETGYYLSKITAEYNIDKYDDVIDGNIHKGIKNIDTNKLSLRESVDLAKIIADLNVKDIKAEDILSKIDSIIKDNSMQDLLTKIDEKSFPYGYGSGFGRLLIYLIDKQTEIL